MALSIQKIVQPSIVGPLQLIEDDKQRASFQLPSDYSIDIKKLGRCKSVYSADNSFLEIGKVVLKPKNVVEFHYKRDVAKRSYYGKAKRTPKKRTNKWLQRRRKSIGWNLPLELESKCQNEFDLLPPEIHVVKTCFSRMHTLNGLQTPSDIKSSLDYIKDRKGVVMNVCGYNTINLSSVYSVCESLLAMVGVTELHCVVQKSDIIMKIFF